jgi:hypothetical protein
VFELTQEELAMVQEQFAGTSMRLEPVTIGETPTVSKLLLRWKAWKVVIDG